MQKYVYLVDLVKSFPTSVYSQKSASIQPRSLASQSSEENSIHHSSASWPKVQPGSPEKEKSSPPAKAEKSSPAKAEKRSRRALARGGVCSVKLNEKLKSAFLTIKNYYYY